MKRMNEVIDKNNILEKRLSIVDENRVRELEQKCSAETMRADRAEKRSEAQAKQINDMLNDPGIQSRWNTILKERNDAKSFSTRLSDRGLQMPSMPSLIS